MDIQLMRVGDGIIQLKFAPHDLTVSPKEQRERDLARQDELRTNGAVSHDDRTEGITTVWVHTHDPAKK